MQELAQLLGVSIQLIGWGLMFIVFLIFLLVVHTD